MFESYGFSPKVIWGVVKHTCGRCGLADVAPHVGIVLSYFSRIVRNCLVCRRQRTGQTNASSVRFEVSFRMCVKSQVVPTNADRSFYADISGVIRPADCRVSWTRESSALCLYFPP